jgi:sugar-specific transcriptional regulator TrmB
MDVEVRQLERLGLTKNESSVYVALLELGSSTSGGIIRKTGIHGSKVYAALERLERKGLANYAIKSGKKSFAAADPSRLLELEKKRSEMVKQLLPELTKLQKQPQETRIDIYQEREGLKNIVQEVLGCRHFDVLASGGQNEEIFPHYSEYVSKQIEKRGIDARAISSGKVKERIKNHRFLPDFIGPFTVVIYDAKIAMIIYAEKPSAIIVESDKACRRYKRYFEMLWKMSRKQI